MKKYIPIKRYEGTDGSYMEFGIIKEIIFRYKLRKYSNQLKHLK